MAPAGNDADVLVVGGGPAGSLSAALLSARGHRVLLLDKARFPRHKACSEYINPAAAHLLAALGLDGDLNALAAHRLAAMRIHAPHGHSFTIDFDAAVPGAQAIGLSRYRLDALLLDRARDAGVEVREGAHVRDVLVDDGCVTGVAATIAGRRELLRAPLTIGADGHASAVARALGLDAPLPWPRRTGLVAHYRGVRGLDRHGEMHVTRHGYAGLAPLEDGLTNVAFVAGEHAVANRAGSLASYFADELMSTPAVAARLAGAERVGGIRGVGPMARRVRRVCGDGFLLVGDAAGFLDPFTGDGIHEALLGAILAAPVADAALGAGDVSARALAPYGAARRRAFSAKRQLSWLVQCFIGTPALMDYASARLGRRPEVALLLAGVLGDLASARDALSPAFLARLLRP
jgi:flavin-dependent dehydrogenase